MVSTPSGLLIYIGQTNQNPAQTRAAQQRPNNVNL